MEENKHNNINNQEDEFLKLPGKHDAFRVPEQYFDRLPGVISNRISTREAIVFTPKPVFSGTSLAVAAAIVVLIVSVWFINYQKTGKNNSNVEITYEDLINSNMNYEFDNDLVIDYYLSLETSSNPIQPTRDAMNEYLIDNEIDLNLIINEL